MQRTFSTKFSKNALKCSSIIQPEGFALPFFQLEFHEGNVSKTLHKENKDRGMELPFAGMVLATVISVFGNAYVMPPNCLVLRLAITLLGLRIMITRVSSCSTSLKAERYTSLKLFTKFQKSFYVAFIEATCTS